MKNIGELILLYRTKPDDRIFGEIYSAFTNYIKSQAYHAVKNAYTDLDKDDIIQEINIFFIDIINSIVDPQRSYKEILKAVRNLIQIKAIYLRIDMEKKTNYRTGKVNKNKDYLLNRYLTDYSFLKAINKIELNQILDRLQDSIEHMQKRSTNSLNLIEIIEILRRDHKINKTNIAKMLKTSKSTMSYFFSELNRIITYETGGVNASNYISLLVNDIS